MGLVIGDGGIGGGGAVAYEGIHLDSEVYHCRVYRELPN